MAVNGSRFLPLEGVHGQTEGGYHGQRHRGNALVYLPLGSTQIGLLPEQCCGLILLVQNKLSDQALSGVACGYCQIYLARNTTQGLSPWSVLGTVTMFVGVLPLEDAASCETVSSAHHLSLIHI